VTLADQATNSIQADDANMAIQGNVAMKVTQPVGQIWNQCKRLRCHPMVKIELICTKSETSILDEIQIRF